MARHRVHHTSVVQYEAAPRRARPLPPPPKDSLASLNTHDMPTFATFWKAGDVAERLAMGLLDEAGARNEERQRARLREAVTAFLRPKGFLGSTRLRASSA